MATLGTGMRANETDTIHGAFTLLYADIIEHQGLADDL